MTTPLPARSAVRTLLLAGALAFAAAPADAQIPRQRAAADGPVEALFWTPQLVGLASAENLPAGTLNVTIMHAFGPVSDGLEDLFGLDGTANIRFGADVGLTDWLSVGVGRSRFDKLYDARFKATLLRQTRSGSVPVQVALKGDVGVTTLENGFGFADRLSYASALLVARRFGERLTLQVAPVYAHFNTVVIEQDTDGTVLRPENDLVALGLGVQYVLSRRLALVAEALPVLGARSDGTHPAVAAGLSIDTGGHVFQVFLTTSLWMTEQHMLARTTDDVLDGTLRLGFNVNRVFGL